MFFKGFSKKELAIFIVLTVTVFGLIAGDTVVYINNYYKEDVIVDADSKVDSEDLNKPEEPTEPVTEPATEEVTEPVTEPATEETTEEETLPAPTEPETTMPVVVVPPPTTQAPTQPPTTQAPTQPPTTQAPTSAPTVLRQEPIGLDPVNWETEYTDVMLDVQDFKQYDERWGSTLIYDKTIKQVGCLITCVSEVYSYKNNVTVNPREMRYKLTFVRNLLVWESVQNNGLTCSQEYGYSIGPNIMNNIYKKLKSGKPVIIGGTTQKQGEGGQHWIVIKGYVSDGTNELKTSNFIINDPGGTERVTLADFLRNYPYIKRLVY